MPTNWAAGGGTLMTNPDATRLLKLFRNELTGKRLSVRYISTKCLGNCTLADGLVYMEDRWLPVSDQTFSHNGMHNYLLIPFRTSY